MKIAQDLRRCCLFFIKRNFHSPKRKTNIFQNHKILFAFLLIKSEFNFCLRKNKSALNFVGKFYFITAATVTIMNNALHICHSLKFLISISSTQWEEEDRGEGGRWTAMTKIFIPLIFFFSFSRFQPSRGLFMRCCIVALYGMIVKSCIWRFYNFAHINVILHICST